MKIKWKMYVEQQEELLKHKKHYRNKNPPVSVKKKIKLSDIEFDDEKIRKLLSRQARKKKRNCYDESNAAAVANEQRTNKKRKKKGIIDIINSWL